ncbi:hypothetical protein SAMN04487905_109187 [Actinopolyspora xinjiangensis]|uniref:Uncharacterized protein n=1 Tax=Actinopolyspora xinjiangensis TaxID=405564 RepID=A0A1H0VRL6_9ACTN|nr:hypothetical protein [Actinopolyspora xinjiangensis]SDP81157.1 hypothetical protein SAMN04487905_109187 [Actinopolyspora xinjiangensis]
MTDTTHTTGTADTPDTAQRAPRYSLVLPEGFIELPGGEPTEEKLRALASAVAVRFGLPEDTEIDQGLAGTAAMLMTLGASAEAGGAHYNAAAVFRSARDERRPLMVVVSCFVFDSRRTTRHTAVAALEQYYGNQPGTEVEVVELPAGESVVTRTATPSTIEVGEEAVEVTNHAVTAWIPGPAVSEILGVSVTSNNTEDWADIVDLAQGVFETVEWLPDEDEAD